MVPPAPDAASGVPVKHSGCHSLPLSGLVLLGVSLPACSSASVGSKICRFRARLVGTTLRSRAHMGPQAARRSEAAPGTRKKPLLARDAARRRCHRCCARRRRCWGAAVLVVPVTTAAAATFAAVAAAPAAAVAPVAVAAWRGWVGWCALGAH